MSKSIFFRRQVSNFGNAFFTVQQFVNWENDGTSISRVVQMYTNGASRVGISVDNLNTSITNVRLTLFVDSISSNMYEDFVPGGKSGFPATTSLVLTVGPGFGAYGSIECTFETMYLSLETLLPGFADVSILLVGWNGQ